MCVCVRACMRACVIPWHLAAHRGHDLGRSGLSTAGLQTGTGAEGYTRENQSGSMHNFHQSESINDRLGDG